MKMIKQITRDPKAINALWDKNSQKIAISGFDGGIYIYSRRFEMTLVLQGFIESVRSFDWNSNSENLAVSHVMDTDRSDFQTPKQRIEVWNVVDNRRVRTLFIDNNHFAAKLAWNNTTDRIAAALSNKSIIIWDARTGDQVAKFGDLAHYSQQLMWISEKHLVSLGYDNTIKLWNTETKDLIYDSEDYQHNLVSHIASSADGSLLLYIQGYGLIKMWDVNQGKYVYGNLNITDRFIYAYFTANNDYIVGLIEQYRPIAISLHDGSRTTLHDDLSRCKSLVAHPKLAKVALALENGMIVLWSISSNKTEVLLEKNDIKINSLHWSPDGTRLLATSEGYGIWLWEVSDTHQLLKKPEKDKINVEGLGSVSWNFSDNTILQGFENGKYTILDLDTERSRVLATMHKETIKTVKWDSTNQTYLIGGYYGSIDIMQLGSREAIKSFRLNGALHNLNWTLDYSRIVGFLSSNTTANRNAAVIIDLSTDNVTQIETDSFYLRWSRNASKYVSIEGLIEKQLTLHIHDLNYLVKSQVLPPSIQNVTVLDWHSNENHICFGTADGWLHVWNIGEAKLVTSVNFHKSRINTVHWHPTKLLLASGGNDNQLNLWNFASDIPMFSHYHSCSISALDWSDDGNRLFAASVDGSISILY